MHIEFIGQHLNFSICFELAQSSSSPPILQKLVRLLHCKEHKRANSCGSPMTMLPIWLNV